MMSQRMSKYYRRGGMQFCGHSRKFLEVKYKSYVSSGRAGFIGL